MSPRDEFLLWLLRVVAVLVVVMTMTMVMGSLLAGCATHELDAKWHPLDQIKGADLPFGLQEKIHVPTATTISDTVYVVDLEKWLKAHPEPLYSATLTHEQLHSARQRQYGVLGWLARYATDREFMWIEEQWGWAYQLDYLRDRGYGIDADAVVRNLLKYRNLAGPMIEEAEARVFVQSVLNGTWSPPKD